MLIIIGLEINWLVTFNICKTKFVTFHYCRTDPEFSPILMNSCTFKEAPCFDRPLEHKFTPDLKRKRYIRSIAKIAVKTVGSLYRLRMYLTPTAKLYLQVRPKMEYYCYAWTRTAQS